MMDQNSDAASVLAALQTAINKAYTDVRSSPLVQGNTLTQMVPDGAAVLLCRVLGVLKQELDDVAEALDGPRGPDLPPNV